MPQFDIVRLTNRRMGIVLQSDLLSDLQTRVVAPLLRKSDVIPTPRLHPSVQVGRQEFVVAMDLIGAVEVSEIAGVVGSAKSMQYEIIRAYDMVLAGV